MSFQFTSRPFMNSRIIPQALLELRHLHRLPADVTHGGVAAADAHRHPAVGEIVQRRIRAREHRRVAGRRIRDEVAELDRRRFPRRDCQHRDRLLPEDVRVVGPRVPEAVRLGELDQLEPARVRRVRQDGDAEVEHPSLLRRGPEKPTAGLRGQPRQRTRRARRSRSVRPPAARTSGRRAACPRRRRAKPSR